MTDAAGALALADGWFLLASNSEADTGSHRRIVIVRVLHGRRACRCNDGNGIDDRSEKMERTVACVTAARPALTGLRPQVSLLAAAIYVQCVSGIISEDRVTEDDDEMDLQFRQSAACPCRLPVRRRASSSSVNHCCLLGQHARTHARLASARAP